MDLAFDDMSHVWLVLGLNRGWGHLHLKTERVPYLGLELTMYVIKSQIHLVRQSLSGEKSMD
jgi:hypothetical protein